MFGTGYYRARVATKAAAAILHHSFRNSPYSAPLRQSVTSPQPCPRHRPPLAARPSVYRARFLFFSFLPPASPLPLVIGIEPPLQTRASFRY
jgi:hypothetical protein